MAEFILYTGSDAAASVYADRDDFTQGYIEAAFFTETGNPDDAENYLEHATLDELSPDAWARIDRDCKAFQEKAADLLAVAYARENYSAEQAGRDYWFTRNGHGVGFWDREPLEADDLGQKLSALSRHNEISLYRGDDGLIYLA